MSQYLQYGDQQLAVGDTLQVSQEITEGDKKRLQIFEGILIADKNSGTGKSFVVRKIGTAEVGVEKIFPVNLPSIKKIIVKRRGQARRAKLYFLRDKKGRNGTKIKEKNLFAKTTDKA